VGREIRTQGLGLRIRMPPIVIARYSEAICMKEQDCHERKDTALAMTDGLHATPRDPE
jgi:hypothetical protein